MVLDLAATGIPLYGHPPERLFHGYYDAYWYLPPYTFTGDQLLIALIDAQIEEAKALHATTQEAARLFSCFSIGR